MPSPPFTSLKGSIARLRGGLIATGLDYDQYSQEDHDRALGFRLLASASVEDYLENRCLEVALEGKTRFLSGQPTRTGRALLIWHIVRSSRASIPLMQAEQIPDRPLLDGAVDAYEKMVAASHGVMARDVRKLVVPLGLEAGDLSDSLFDQLDAWGTVRGAAAHVRINRAKTMRPPEAEWSQLQPIMDALAVLDDALERVCTDF